MGYHKTSFAAEIGIIHQLLFVSHKIPDWEQTIRKVWVDYVTDPAEDQLQTFSGD